MGPPPHPICKRAFQTRIDRRYPSQFRCNGRQASGYDHTEVFVSSSSGDSVRSGGEEVPGGWRVSRIPEGVSAETAVSDSVRADDDPFRIVSSVQRVERHTNSFWRFVTVSNTRHWCSSSCLIINSAIWALLAYSLHNNFTSLDIGHEKIRHASRERRTRFGNVLQDTPHMNSEISQWRPLMAK